MSRVQRVTVTCQDSSWTSFILDNLPHIAQSQTLDCAYVVRITSMEGWEESLFEMLAQFLYFTVCWVWKWCCCAVIVYQLETETPIFSEPCFSACVCAHAFVCVCWNQLHFSVNRSRNETFLLLAALFSPFASKSNYVFLHTQLWHTCEPKVLCGCVHEWRSVHVLFPLQLLPNCFCVCLSNSDCIILAHLYSGA